MDDKMDLPVKADVSEATNLFLKELALPAATQIGLALGNVCGLLNSVTLPIKLGNEYAQRNYAKFAKKLEKIDQEKVRQVEPEIAIPLMEKLSYTSNEDLANAYANLLASASNIDKVDLVHPGFIQKIDSMAPDEAMLLKYLKDKKTFQYIYYDAVSPDGNTIQLSIKLTGFERELKNTSQLVSVHIENLISLRILEDKSGQFYSDDKEYVELIDLYQDTFKEYEQKVEEGKYEGMSKVEIKKSLYEVTTLGKIFIKACTDLVNE